MLARRWPLVLAAFGLLAAGLAIAVVLPGQPAEPDESASLDEGPDPALAPSSPQPASAASAGVGAIDRGVTDQLGRRATACIDRMHAREPHAQGVLSLKVRLVADGPGRSVIDDLAPNEDNEIEDTELFDCLAEGSFGLQLGPAGFEHELTRMVEPHGH